MIFKYTLIVSDKNGKKNSGIVILDSDCDESARRTIIGQIMKQGRHVLKIVPIEITEDKDIGDDDEWHEEY